MICLVIQTKNAMETKLGDITITPLWTGNNIKALVALVVSLIKEIDDLRTPEGGTPCAVFDIDDTLILESGNMWILFDSIAQIYHYLVKQGWCVYLITARYNSADVREFTRNQMTLAKIDSYLDAHHCPGKYRTDRVNVSLWKQKIRDSIAKKHGCVTLSFGDNFADFVALPELGSKDMLEDKYAKAFGVYLCTKTEGGDLANTVIGVKTPQRYAV